uniref:Mediator of RNA polymerase II transcription subunit 6 n=1 Tax=Meloidogyne incognita TaxID=6306 RepID=A0A914MXB8_MELIC
MLPSSAIDASSTIVDTTLNAGGRQQQGVSGVTQQAETGNRFQIDRRMLEQPWKDPRFFPITIDTVMAYFCQRENPFFDVNSDNAFIMMQHQVASGPQFDEMLKKMEGIQYVLVQPPSSPPLFVVRKQRRMSADKITPLCHYYVLDGTVYQAPDLYTFLHSKLIGIIDPLRNAFLEAIEMTRFSSSKGYSWEFKTKPSKRVDEEEEEEMDDNNYLNNQKKDKDEEDSLTVRATPYQQLRTDMLLQELTTQFKFDQLKIEMPQPTTDQSNSQYQAPSSPALTTDFQGLIFEGLNQSNEATMYVEQEHE